MRGPLVAIAIVFCGCGGDAGLIDCPAYIDKQIECGIIPPAR